MADIFTRIASWSPDQQAKLADRVKREPGYLNLFIPSFAQERLWFLEQLAPGRPVYNLPASIGIAGHLDINALEQALTEIVRRHQTLRTTFVALNGELFQAVNAPFAVKLGIVDYSVLRQSEREIHLERLIAQEAEAPFDLERGPLLRATLARLTSNSCRILVTMHHIVSDGWSMGVFVNEMAILYKAFSQESVSPLLELPVQYADFALWQRGLLAGDTLESHLSYWRVQLENMPKLALPVDHRPPPKRNLRAAVLDFELTPELTAWSTGMSRRANTTLFTVVLAVFKLLLHRYTGQEDIVVGCPVANRNQPEVEGLIGFFVNVVVLRTDLRRAPTFIEFLGRVRQTALDAFTHQDLPFEKLVEALQPAREADQNPLFQLSFAYQNAPKEQLEMIGLQVTDVHLDLAMARFDMECHVREENDRLLFRFIYSPDLFDVTTIERMASHFDSLTRAVSQHPEVRLGELSVLTASERRQIMEEWNNTRYLSSHDRSIIANIEIHAIRKPETVALVDGGRTMSYWELDQRSNQLARHLRSIGAQPGVLIGVCLHPSIEMVVGLLGILKAGAAYVPMDPSYPSARLQLMTSAIKIPFVLSRTGLFPKNAASLTQIVALDQDWDKILQQNNASMGVESQEFDLIYAIFTSGSTGQPKAAGVYHHGFQNLLEWEIAEFEIDAEDRTLLISSMSFDLTQKNVFIPLLTGGMLYFPHQSYFDPWSIVNQVAQDRITVLNCAPSAFYSLLEDSGPDALALLKSVRLLMLGGEPISMNRLARWTQSPHFQADIVNSYGPTECSDVVAFHRLDLARPSDLVPIGRPVCNTALLVVNADMELCPVGIAGELCVLGQPVGAGYIGDPELTAAKFVPNPFVEFSGLRLYRTGDMAKWLPSGELEFLGRSDYQIKLHGIRIELGEIEAAIRREAAIQEAAVMVREEETGAKRLVAYITAKSDFLSTDQAMSWNAYHLEQWESVYDEVYRAAAGKYDSTFNTAGWNSSYSGASIPKEEMLEWVERTVERILSLHPQRLMEIGCGTGLLLLRLAAHCQWACGTDISQAALDYLRDQIELSKFSAQIELLKRPAHDFSGFERGSVDCIVLNSVVQYFPDVEYLSAVIKNAAALFPPLGGTIFIGDVRSMPLLRAYFGSVLAEREPGATPAVVIARLIESHAIREEELVIAPWYFLELRKTLPGLRVVRTVPKRGRHRNELTAFRYDVILQFGPERPEYRPADWIDWGAEGLTLGGVRDLLGGADSLAISGLPDSRTAEDFSRTELLNDPSVATTWGSVMEAAKHNAKGIGANPEDLWVLGEEMGFSVDIMICPAEGPPQYSAVFRRGSSRERLTDSIDWYIEVSSRRRLQQLNTRPLQSRMERALTSLLRQRLQDELPEHMIPNDFMLLEKFPLTPSGKIDRSALPAHCTIRVADRPFVGPGTDLEEVIASVWMVVLGLERISVYDNFFEIGGHSLLATQVISRIRDLFQMNVPLRSLFENPTIHSFADVLAHCAGSYDVALQIAAVILEVARVDEKHVRGRLAELSRSS